MRLLIARHGESEMNAAKLVCGITDSPLNETGILQAQALADTLANEPIDAIIASPLKRAYTTASFTAERLGLPIQTDARLVEQDFGRYEGTPRAPSGSPITPNDVFMGREGGETLLQMAHRVYGFMDDILVQYAGKVLLVVAHGGVCRMVHTWFHRISIDELMAFHVANCQVREYISDTRGGEHDAQNRL